MTRPPPTRLVQALTAVRTTLQNASRRMVPPEIGLLELASGFMGTQAVYAAARLGIADTLADGPLSAEDVAADVGSNPDATYRLLRACAAFGVFRERTDGRFELTHLANGLRSGTRDSMLPVVMMLGDQHYQGTWAQLASTVVTGRPGVEEALGMPMWTYLDEDPEFGATFNDAMTRLTTLDWPAIRSAYDFTRFSTIVDIGGGHGQLLALILEAAPGANGVLLERPTLLEDAQDLLRAAGVLTRCRTEPGSFFETAPADGDLYVLRRVLHDFDDEQAAEILDNVRRHMPRGSTLLVLESVVPLGNAPHMAKSLDLDMMLFVGGRERTEQEFVALLQRVGFRPQQVTATMSPLSIIEALPER